jgi:hypothetical protein
MSSFKYRNSVAGTYGYYSTTNIQLTFLDLHPPQDMLFRIIAYSHPSEIQKTLRDLSTWTDQEFILCPLLDGDKYCLCEIKTDRRWNTNPRDRYPVFGCRSSSLYDESIQQLRKRHLQTARAAPRPPSHKATSCTPSCFRSDIAAYCVHGTSCRAS